MGNCIAKIVRQSDTTALVTLTPPSGTIIIGVQAPTTVNCNAYVNPDYTITLNDITDLASIWFSLVAVTLFRPDPINPITVPYGVENATQISPLQVPLYNPECNFCGTETPMTGETYMRLTRGRATVAGPGESDVRIVARRTWGDDFAGCSTCNNTASATISGVSTGIISGSAAVG
jgi:hypothetical protein